MFQNNGYATPGYLKMDPCLRGMVFTLLQMRLDREEDVDYLQVFKFQKEKDGIRVTHSQECPPMEETFHFILDTRRIQLPDENIWVIDSGSYHTFLLPSEY